MAELTEDQIRAAVAQGVRDGFATATPPRQNQSTSNSSSGSGSFGVSAQDFGKSLGTAAGALLKPFQQAGGTVSDAARNLGTLSGQVASLGGVIPLVDGAFEKLGGAGGAMIGFLENTNATFQNLSKVGAGFNGDLGALRMAAAQTRMPLEQFANMVGSNASALVGLGGSVNQGAARFAQLSRAMFEDGQTIQGMMNLGYTLEEANEFLLDNAALMRRQAMREGMSDGQVAQATLRMAENIAFMAEITGESAEQQRQELIDAQRDGKTQAALRLAEMDGATAVQESFNQAFTGLQAAGPAAQALYQDYLQTGVAMSETTQAFEAMNPAVAAQIRSIAQLTESQMSADEKRTRIAALLDQANANAVASTTSRTNLEVAAAGQATRIGALQAETLASQQDFIDGVEQQRVQMEKELGRPVSIQEAFDNMSSEVRQRISGQSAGGAPGQELSRVINDATIKLADSASNVNQKIAANLSANTELQNTARTAIEALTTATAAGQSLIAQGVTAGGEALQGGPVGPDNIGTEFRSLFEPIISNNAMNANITNLGALTDSIITGLDNATDLVFGGARAAGGPIETGKYYTVGEKGPETLIPGLDGTIVPNLQSMAEQMMPSIKNIAARASESMATTGQFDPTELIQSMQQSLSGINKDMSTSKMEQLLDNLNQSMLQLIQINNSVARNSGKQIDALRGAGNLLQGVSIR